MKHLGVKNVRVPVVAGAALVAAVLAVSRMASTAVHADPIPQPILIESCASEFLSTTNPNLKVGLAFQNVSDVTAVEITFDIALADSSDSPLAAQTVSISGKFSPNVLVQPRRSPVTNALVTQDDASDSPAWRIANRFGWSASRVHCNLKHVKFADGTAWDASTRVLETPQPGS